MNRVRATVGRLPMRCILRPATMMLCILVSPALLAFTVGQVQIGPITLHPHPNHEEITQAALLGTVSLGSETPAFAPVMPFQVSISGTTTSCAPYSPQNTVCFTPEITELVKVKNKETDSADKDVKFVHADFDLFDLANQRLLDRRTMIVTFLKNWESTHDDSWVQRAQQFLGGALHTLQDFYAHSTWIEENVAAGQLSVPPAPLGIPGVPAPAAAPSGANVCSFTAGQIIGDTSSGLLVKTGLLVSGNQVPLTSGYYDANEFEVGIPRLDWQSCYSPLQLSACAAVLPTQPDILAEKCTHGVNSIGNVFGAGINKDASVRDFFVQARDTAVAATVQYVQNVVSDIRNQSPSDPSLLFQHPDDAVCALVTGSACTNPLVIMAETGDGFQASGARIVASFDSKVGVNSSGTVAFSETNVDGTDAGMVSAQPRQYTVVTFLGGSSRNYGGATINDAIPAAQAVFRERVSGAPPVYFMRRWDTTGSSPEVDIGMSPGDFDSASFFQDVNNAGVAVFPALINNSQQQVLLAGDGSQSQLNRFLGTHILQTLGVFSEGPGVLLRPQIASTNDVVYQDGSGNVAVSRYDGSSNIPTPSIVAPATAFTTTTDRPGISPDGNYVAFGGSIVGDAAPGLFVAQRGAPGALTTFAGPKKLLRTGAGGDPTTGMAMFNSFGIRPSGGIDQTRFGIVSRPATAPSVAQLTLVFTASRSYLDSATMVFGPPVSGVYSMTVLVDLTGNYSVQSVQKIVEVGDTMSDPNSGGATRTVVDFDLWDPISQNALFAAFWVQFKEPGPGGAPMQAVVRTGL